MENVLSVFTQTLAGSEAAPVVSQITSLIVWSLLPLPAAGIQTFLQALSQPKIDWNEKSKQCRSVVKAVLLNGRVVTVVVVMHLGFLLIFSEKGTKIRGK